MSNRRITVETFPTTEPNKVLRADVYYDQGGISYFSGSSRKRGYYLSITPVKVEGAFTSVRAFSGTCDLLEEVSRYAERRLQEHAQRVRNLPIYQKLIEHVQAKNDIKLAAEAGPVAEDAATLPVADLAEVQ